MPDYKSIQSVVTPSVRLKQSIHIGSTFDSDEVSFWSRQFGLCSSNDLPRDGYVPGSATHTHASSKSNFCINDIAFGPTERHRRTRQMAISSGPRVALYNRMNRTLSNMLSSSNFESDRNISCDDIAYCSTYRSDGRLLAIGSADGSIKVMDVSSKATLRTYNPSSSRKRNSSNSLGVRSIAWWRDGKRLLTGGDDAVVRVWDLNNSDLNSPRALLELKGHADSIRKCKIVKHMNRTLAITASYDHTVRVWDVSSVTTGNNSEDRLLSVLDHGAPVEDVVVLSPSVMTTSTTNNGEEEELLFLSAGGTDIHLWNGISGKKITSVCSHAKTITTLCLVTPQQMMTHKSDETDTTTNETNSKPSLQQARLLSGGLDGLLRIYSLFDDDHDTTTTSSTTSSSHITLTPLHGIKTKSAISAIQMSPDGRRLIIGCADGVLSVRHRRDKKRHLQRSNKKRKLGGTYAFFQRESTLPMEQDCYEVLCKKKRQLKKFDVAMRKFQYSEALDEALNTKSPNVVAALLEELSRRRGLVPALSNRDEDTLEPILSFTTRYIAQPRLTPLLIGVAKQLIHIYHNVMGQSMVIDELFQKLKRHIQTEIKTQQNLLQLMGQIDVVLYKRGDAVVDDDGDSSSSSEYDSEED